MNTWAKIRWYLYICHHSVNMGFTGAAGGEEPACQCSTHDRCGLWSLGQKDPLEEGMATHSNILAWRIPMDRGAWWAQSMELQSRTWLKQLSTQHSVHVLPTVVSLSVCEKVGWGERESDRESWYFYVRLLEALFIYILSIVLKLRSEFFFTFFFPLSRISLSLFSFASYNWSCSQVISWVLESPIFSLKP